MLTRVGRKLRGRAMPLFAAGGLMALVGLGACDGGILDVDEGGIVVPEDIDAAGPAAIPTIINGMVGDFHRGHDGVNRYSSMLTDEMLLSGTFPTRFQVDDRTIIANNLTLTVEMYGPLHRARLAADTAVFIFENRLDDPDFAEVEAMLQEGIALGKLYGAYSRLMMAEVYCWSILTGMAEETTPMLPDARAQQAIGVFQEAEQLAEQLGLEDVRLAAIVGQARANLWLRNFDQAAELASEVPRDFIYWSEFSANDPDQFNLMYAFTWGDTESIRWSVGDGTFPARGNEIFEHFDEFVALNLITPTPPGLSSFQGTIPVNLQMLYNQPNANIRLASGTEARLIEAEAAVRAGQAGQAEALINDLREDFSTRATITYGVEPPPEENLLQPISVSADLEEGLRAIAAERARELWLTGDRHVTSRRLIEDGIDLFPPRGGADIAFPIVQRELDNNPNLSSGDACPAGAPGSWQ